MAYVIPLLLWWTLLILMLVAMYRIFTADPRARWQGKRDGAAETPMLTPDAKRNWQTEAGRRVDRGAAGSRGRGPGE